MIPSIILGLLAILFFWLGITSTMKAEKAKSAGESGASGAMGVLIVMLGLGCAVGALVMMPKSTAKPKVGESDGDQAAFQKGATGGKTGAGMGSASGGGGGGSGIAPLRPGQIISQSDGYDWRRAPEAEKRKYAAEIAAQMNRIHGTNFTADFIYNALEKAYDPSDTTSMFRPIGEVVQAIVTVEMQK